MLDTIILSEGKTVLVLSFQSECSPFLTSLHWTEWTHCYLLSKTREFFLYISVTHASLHSEEIMICMTLIILCLLRLVL